MPQLDTTTYVTQGLSVLIGLGVLLILIWFGSYLTNRRYLYIDDLIAFSYLFVFQVEFSRRLIVLAGPMMQLSLLVNVLYLPQARQTLPYKF